MDFLYCVCMNVLNTCMYVHPGTGVIVVWMLGTKSGSSERTASVLNH